MSMTVDRPGADLDDTPIVTIDLDIMEANIHRLQAYCDAHGIANRPHIKTHKSPVIAKLQIAAGAAGITCQKLGEAEVMLEAGIRDILITYNILGEAKLRRLREMAAGPGVRLSVAIDSATVAGALSGVFAGAGEPMPVLLECDTGGGRQGAQTPEEALETARAISELPGLRFEGIMTHPVGEGTAAFFGAALALLEGVGLAARTVSTGGTPYYNRAHSVPGVTEHRAGTYLFNDRASVAVGAASWDDCAMRIRTTVVSRPTPTRAIIDAGSKTLSSDLGSLTGHGRIVEYPEAVIYRLNEEHGYVDLTACRAWPEIGEVVTVIPNHTCTVTNLHDHLVGVRVGTVETVWPVATRGLVR